MRPVPDRDGVFIGRAGDAGWLSLGRFSALARANRPLAKPARAARPRKAAGCLRPKSSAIPTRSPTSRFFSVSENRPTPRARSRAYPATARVVAALEVRRDILQGIGDTAQPFGGSVLLVRREGRGLVLDRAGLLLGLVGQSGAGLGGLRLDRVEVALRAIDNGGDGVPFLSATLNEIV